MPETPLVSFIFEFVAMSMIFAQMLSELLLNIKISIHRDFKLLATFNSDFLKYNIVHNYFEMSKASQKAFYL